VTCDQCECPGCAAWLRGEMTAAEILRWCYRHQVRLEFEQVDGKVDLCQITVWLRGQDETRVSLVRLRSHDRVPEDLSAGVDKLRQLVGLE